MISFIKFISNQWKYDSNIIRAAASSIFMVALRIPNRYIALAYVTVFTITQSQQVFLVSYLQVWASP